MFLLIGGKLSQINVRTLLVTYSERIVFTIYVLDDALGKNVRQGNAV